MTIVTVPGSVVARYRCCSVYILVYREPSILNNGLARRTLEEYGSLHTHNIR